jgi:hypothetical protein
MPPSSGDHATEHSPCWSQGHGHCRGNQDKRRNPADSTLAAYPIWLLAREFIFFAHAGHYTTIWSNEKPASRRGEGRVAVDLGCSVHGYVRCLPVLVRILGGGSL